jgi:ABC-type Fe3+ transport system permease subunit
MEDVLVPVSLFLMIFAILYVYFTTRNKERMALIEKGADPKLFKSEPKSSHYATFKWGLFMVGVALGIFLGVLFDEYSSLDEVSMYFSMILICGGIALVLAYLLRGRLEKKPQ